MKEKLPPKEIKEVEKMRRERVEKREQLHEQFIKETEEGLSELTPEQIDAAKKAGREREERKNIQI
jgi:vacuolar-type H+-ATPase subunit H